ncbi:Uncharacterised protein [uncultured archaeon]|nr:Uncharacterised protein [uncultured archaeon]
MTIRCKFRCDSVKKTYNAYDKRYLYEYEMYAVTSGSEENVSFWQYTPSGTLKVTGVRDDLFEVGKEYYINIVVAEAVPAP